MTVLLFSTTPTPLPLGSGGGDAYAFDSIGAAIFGWLLRI